MRTKLKNTAEVFHYWANQVQAYGECGNVRFDGPLLFSYAEPIARLINDDLVLIQSRTFSMTTSGHCSDARRAVHSRKVLFVPYMPRLVGAHNAGHDDNRNYWMDTLARISRELAQYPRRKKRLTAESNAVLFVMSEYAQYFSLDWELNHEAILAQREAERAEQERRREAEAARRIAEQKENLEKWKAGEDVRMNFSTTALRIKGDAIQTSHGAEIPVVEAKWLWPLLLRAKRNNTHIDFENMKLGVYLANHFNRDNNGELVVGCHTIKWEEIERMSQQLQLSNEVEQEAA